ncbi:indole-3-glycerol phosphate synthase TrpC [Roseibium marinum]|uniref:Indole-3-glycerol phosphate synthase n=1 Tax=Roseibium marinum TaxID=281252 RepID=A0A2S3V0Y8_9HYPH|nr:indole-3-glycerol phosphate synthase TrpC [Roseibium marinum]POF33637.1 indole-3-glycerol phosphate synthase [Roseibium marinum]
MSILDKIKAHKVEEVANLKATGALTEFEAVSRSLPPPRDFTGAIAAKYAADEVALIGEIKKASPSKGLIRADFDVSRIARSYLQGGAACLSVLTDTKFFQGHRDFVALAREVSGLPVLRKDFVIDPIQVTEARAMQADCILLILAMLDDDQARELEAAAEELGLHVLIEIHDDGELDRALAMNARLIGINNRDLTSFKADLGTTSRLVRRIGPDRLVISESGIGGPEDVSKLVREGIRGFLIGEALMRSPEIEISTQEITSIRFNS